MLGEYIYLSRSSLQSLSGDPVAMIATSLEWNMGGERKSAEFKYGTKKPGPL